MKMEPITLPPNARCPECGILAAFGAKMDGRPMAACLECRTVWEPLPADAPPNIGLKPQPFRKSCDNCAFHKNSRERSDRDYWEGLEMNMAFREQPFFCHKGVPVQVEGDGWPKEHGFRYPIDEMGNEDPARLRLCAGFIAWWKALCGAAAKVPGLD